MKLSIDNLIIGAGYSGLIFQHELRKAECKSVIIEKGYSHGYTGDDYVVFTKNEFDFSKSGIKVNIEKLSSGNKPFDMEYVKKVYNSKKEVSLFCDEDSFEEQIGFPVNSEILLEDSCIYGNIEVTKIDIINSVVYGRILHLNKNVEIEYNNLINTMSIHEFCKLANINVFKKFGLFISYFPVGIKKIPALNHSDDMVIQYYSDPNIPFYRKQHYGKTIYYEYCLNKKMEENFNNVIIPGKFRKVNPSIRIDFMNHLESLNVWNLGRFAQWNPDFLLDDIVTDKSIYERIL